MKKIFLLVIFLLPTAYFAQPVAVSASTAQIMANKIINTKCVTTSNWVVKSGSNFAGNNNSVGLFSGSTNTFPFANGIVLSTGFLSSIPGPKIIPSGASPLGDGTTDNVWTSDPDMNTNLGVAANAFVNASSLEFNFKSQKPEFKLSYVFASNEYGNEQCPNSQVSDVMMILLTDLTDASIPVKNIAKTATNDIISPIFIRNSTFNTTNGCGSVNANLFGTFYSGSLPLLEPINFYGRTIPMTALATVDPTHDYKIKIIIADRLDREFDSSVFISNYTPTSSQAILLGPDITAANTTLCEGIAHTITSLVVDPTANNFYWKKDSGPYILGTRLLNVPAADASGTHIYRLIHSNVTCQPFDTYIDEISITYAPVITSNEPIALFNCVGSSSFNLNFNRTRITQGFTGLTVTFHEDAACVSAPLANNYTGTQTVIWAKIVKTGSPCPPKKISFVLGFISTPIEATAPLPIRICSRGTNVVNNVVNLGALNSSVLGGQSPTIYGVSYHLSDSGASNNTQNIVLDGNGNAIVGAGTIHIRVFLKSNPECFKTTFFDVIVDPLRAADKLNDVVYCGNGPGYKLPPLENGKYFENPYNPLNPDSQLAEIQADTFITIPSGINGTYTKTIYISNLVTVGEPCTQEWPFKITLIQPSTFSELTKSFCESYNLPELDFGEYRSEPNGGGVVIAPGIITQTTTIHFYFKSVNNTPLNPECIVPAGPITITIEPLPDLGPERPNVFNCTPVSNPYILPALTIPGANYYNGPDGTGGIIPVSDYAITTSRTIYVYKKTDYLDTNNVITVTCSKQDDFEVVIGLGGNIVINACNYKLPIQPVGQYYPSMNGVGTPVAAGTDIETNTILYLYVPLPAGTTNCDASFNNEVKYDITVTQPIVDNIPGFDTTAAFQCGPFVLEPLTNGKYYTESHLNGGTGGTLIQSGEVINTVRSVWVYNFIPGSNPLCEFEKKFEFRYRALPPLSQRGSIYKCDDLQYILPPMGDGQGSEGDYYTQPNGTGSRLRTVDERTIPFSTNVVTIYLYNIDRITGCENGNDIENPSDPPALQNRRNSIQIAFPRTLADAPVNGTNAEEHCTRFTLPALVVPGAKYVLYADGIDPNTPIVDPDNPPPPPPYTDLTNTSLNIPAGFVGEVYNKTYYIYNSTYYGIREKCPINNKVDVFLYRKPDLSAFKSQMYFCSTTPIIASQLEGGAAQKYYTKSHITNTATESDLISATTELTDGQEVYAYELNKSIVAGSTFAGCFDEKKVKVNILRIDPSSTLEGCGSVTLKNLTIGGAYFSNPNGANPITNNVLTYDATATYPKDIYIYKASGFPGGIPCAFLENKVSVTITPRPTANAVPVIERTFCDDDAVNDGVKEITLSTFNATILGPLQTGGNYVVTYYSTNPPLATNIITTVQASTTTVYGLVKNNDFIEICESNVLQVDLKVNKLPEPTPKSGFICINNLTDLPIGNYTFNSQLAPSIHSFVWKNESGTTVSTTSQLITNIAGEYSLIASNTNVTPNCASKEVKVTLEKSSIALTGYTVSEYFTDNQSIVVVVDGYGDNYEYQLDGGIFQGSNVFENVASGLHTIVVKDANGCGLSSPIDALIINYIKYFTPNSDGINDTWNIKDLDLLQKNSKISIFDRQGKLLKQISTSGTGWDGNYNGRPVPADDYWFVVNYVDKGAQKEFKANFSIKR